MSKEAISVKVWENNQDTPLTASNLSKTIDIQSESKFINFDNSITAYENYADIVLEIEQIPAEPSDEMIDKCVYSMSSREYKKGNYDAQFGKSWTSLISPYNKVLSISPFTKITLKYVNSSTGETQYEVFDTKGNFVYFSIASLITGSSDPSIENILGDFEQSTLYNIYLYHNSTYGDCAKFKIVREIDDTDNANWKVNSSIDLSSPTGRTTISYRKIGSFKTDINKYIISSSISDISIQHTEVISANMYKIIQNKEIRSINASDIPMTDSGSLYTTNVQVSLSEVKEIASTVQSDIYNSGNRFGCELKYSQFKKDNVYNQLTEIQKNSNEIVMKITAGFIDVLGVRVKIEEDIYLASTMIPIKIVGSSSYTPIFNSPYSDATKRILGQMSNRTIQEGLWRVFIDSEGRIIFKIDAEARPTYQFDLKGWYHTGDRCIGKFKVKYVQIPIPHLYIEKMSITNTYDSDLPVNTIITYHGSMCPDGLLPCDGKWHDINGIDTSAYTVMPTTIASWRAGSWYEDTPDLWNRTIKQISFRELPYENVEFSITGNEVSGSSKDCGAYNDILSSTHKHTYSHNHSSGDLKAIGGYGSHTHSQEYINFTGDADAVANVNDLNGSVSVARNTHKHAINITSSGTHEHSNFTGSTSYPSPDYTDPVSSWAPYKEMIFCIKK